MERTCADCRFFRVTQEREDSNVGRCRLEKVIGVFRDSMRACPSFSRHGEARLPAPSTGRRRVSSPRRSTASAPAPRPRVAPSTIAEALQTLEPDALKAVLVECLGGTVVMPMTELARGWTGNLVLAPADSGLKSKDVPLEQFWRKLVSVRDNLRVLEQKLNSHGQLSDAEKIDLQARVTRCHGAALSVAARWAPVTLPEGVDPAGRQVLLGLIREMEWDGLALPAPILGDRWRGGRVHYGTDGLGVEESMEAFFHRLVVLRDRLLGLEAVVAAHPRVSGSEAGQMASYIRRSFGSLTTFNILFKDRADYFSSSR